MEIKKLIFPIFFVLFSVGCSSLLYYPTRHKYVSEGKLTHPPEEVRFKSEDGQVLNGWYFRAHKNQTAPVTFLFFHGNGENMSSHFISLYWILDHGYDFFIFDYPGYGPNDGDPTPQNTVETGYAAFRWLKDQIGKSGRIAIFAQSLGGAAGLKMGMGLNSEERAPVCLFVAESTFLSYRAVAADALRSQWWTWPFQWLPFLVLSDKWAPKEGVKKISPIPIVVIHGDADPIIDYRRGQELFTEANAPKEFWSVEGGRHIDAFTGQKHKKQFQEKLLAAVKRSCSK